MALRKPHKHAELIKAWVEGAEIEWVYATQGDGTKLWAAIPHPVWYESHEYRIKPEPKPLSNDEIKEAFNQWLMLDEGVARFDYQLKHTWVAEQWERWQEAFKLAKGETGELKSAEVLK